MGKPYAKRTLKVMEHFRQHPDAPVLTVAAKHNMALSQVYALRKRVQEEQDEPAPWQPPEMVPVPEVPTTDVDEVLDERAKDYGKFIGNAEIIQMIKRVVHSYIEDRGTALAFDQREALDMIIHKMGRIINGNPDKVDHWTDIAGYATLVADRLEGNAR